jgi:LPXTG-motif cell wall-anchored protein
MIRRTILAVAVTVTALVGLAGAASALEYTPEVESAQVQAASTDSGAVAVSNVGSLPYTGSNNSLPLAEIGAGLLAVGGLTVVVVRRRQATSA